MPHLSLPCWSVALLFVLAPVIARAQMATAPARAVMQLAPTLEVAYERMAPAHTVNPPGRLDGSVVTPAGRLRTTVHAEPTAERMLRPGETTFELPTPVLGGRLELRGLEGGGKGAVWRAPLSGGLTAEALGERGPAMNRHTLRLKQDFGDGDAAQAALLSSSSTLAGQGWGWNLELAQRLGRSIWSMALEGADRSHALSSGGPPARAGLRLGAQVRIATRTQLEGRYTRQVHWQPQKSVSQVVLGARYHLPSRFTLNTGVETHPETGYRASVTLSMPLAPR